jgi:hypothetical protein
MLAVDLGEFAVVEPDAAAAAVAAVAAVERDGAGLEPAQRALAGGTVHLGQRFLWSPWQTMSITTVLARISTSSSPSAMSTP